MTAWVPSLSKCGKETRQFCLERVSPPQGSINIQKLAAFFTLRTQAARNLNAHDGFDPYLGAPRLRRSIQRREISKPCSYSLVTPRWIVRSSISASSLKTHWLSRKPLKSKTLGRRQGRHKLVIQSPRGQCPLCAHFSASQWLSECRIGREIVMPSNFCHSKSIQIGPVSLYSFL